ncbi:50S ribosomal protein L10 [Candidatus Woesearchaeota archaeon]|nr:50S ribosomal protein L10 [Candidatus Woesearchaeota archaeon]
MKAKAAPYKKKAVSDLVQLLNEYPVVGVVNLENMPSPQIQKMRESLRKDVVIRMTKRRLMLLALEQVKAKKPGVEHLQQYIKGMPAFLLTKTNPFKLYSVLQKNKSSAPAKGGQVAPKDIVVPAGVTPFAPGPVIGELGALKIKTGVEGGKVAIKEDTLVVKEGEVIQANVASVLTRLGIQPMEIGLDLVATFENGVIFDKKVLAVDEKVYYQNLITCAQEALNLAVEAAYPTKDTVELLLSKAHSEAKGLAKEQAIMCSALAEEFVAQASLEAQGLGTQIGFDIKA